jgi:Fe-S-cluster containining protein
MKELIEEWEQNAVRKVDENFDFLTSLKFYPDPNKVDRIAREAHDKVFSEIDCTKCANCCKTMRPQVSREDFERISSFLEISETEFIEKYLKKDDGGDKFEINTLPCPFLKDDKCSIYEVRPTDCQDFPHTNKKNFSRRRYMHTVNTETCPAVYHIIEGVKKEIY